MLQDGEAFLAEVLGRVQLGTDAAACVGSSDLVIEAIIENLSIKQKLFSSLDKAAPQ